MNTAHTKQSSVYIYYHTDNPRAAQWAKKIGACLHKHHIPLSPNGVHAHTIIALGGDGTILEAARIFQKNHHIILGLNLGSVGFLASVRAEKDFIPQLTKFFSKKYTITKRMMLSVSVERDKKIVFRSHALNEVVIQNPLGMSETEVYIEGHSAQFIRGSGLLVATATGSTAFNLSAHGPIVMPDIPCMIITELLDHNMPTPSMVIHANKHITIHIKHFRKQGLLANTATTEALDVILSTDGSNIFALKKGDVIHINRSPRLIRFAELEKNYFLKSIQEKFSFR